MILTPVVKHPLYCEGSTDNNIEWLALVWCWLKFLCYCLWICNANLDFHYRRLLPLKHVLVFDLHSCSKPNILQTTHVAAQYGQTAFLYHIVSKWNADPDVPDNEGRTPLHWYSDLFLQWIPSLLLAKFLSSLCLHHYNMTSAMII